MKYTSEEIARVVLEVMSGMTGAKENEDMLVPVGVSNRHVHLTRAHVEKLFGTGYTLTPMKDLSQPGQYACKETVTIIGPSMRPIENVRVLGPERSASQVEISATDSYVLKVKPPVRESGKIEGSASVKIVGPRGIVELDEGCIIANRHIHMSLEDAKKFGLEDGDYVDVLANGTRKTMWYDVQVRAHKSFVLEMHVDTDDANAVGIGNGAKVKLIKK